MTELEMIQKILAWQTAQSIGYEDEEDAKQHAALFTVDYDNNFCKALMIGSQYREYLNRDHWMIGDPWDEVVSGLLNTFVMEDYVEAVSLFFSEDAARKKLAKDRCFDTCDYMGIFQEKDGTLKAKWVHSVQYIFVEDEHMKAAYWVIEVDAYQRSQNALRYIAEHDQLTGLYNRHKMAELLTNRPNAIYILMDINEFKSINDTYGHMAGDDALKALAIRLEGIFHHRQNDLIFRLGGDEFLVVLLDGNELRAMKAMELMQDPIPVSGGFEISVSMGYAIGSEYRETVKRADTALYYVKEHGNSGFYKMQ